MIDYRSYEGNLVKRPVWIILGVLSFAFAVTMVFFYPFKHPLSEELGSASVVILPLMALQLFCGLWMLYRAIRYEAKPVPYIFLAAFVPFSYIWYYFERFRPRKQTSA